MCLESSLSFRSKNGDTYIYSLIDKRWYAMQPAETLPDDVIDQVRGILEKAEKLRKPLGN